MKLNSKNLIKMVKSVLEESYGDIGSEEPTERMPQIMMNKEKFIKERLLDWAHEFEAADQGEVEIIEEILKDAYEEIAHALELDNTGLYESRRGWGRSSSSRHSGLPKFQSAQTLRLYDPDAEGGKRSYEIKSQPDGEFLTRYIIFKDGRQLELHQKTNENEIYPTATDMNTGDRVNLIPNPERVDYGQLKNMIELI